MRISVIIFGLLAAVGLSVAVVVSFSRSRGVLMQASNRTIGADARSEGGEATALSREEGRSAKPIRILFAGDMMFDRYIRVQSEKIGKPAVVENVAEELASVDVVVANLEGPITSNVSKSVGSVVGESRHFSFTFDPEWANVLFENNIRIVNIGNNHILNFGESGLIETRNFLRDANVKFFGDPLDESLRAYGTEIGGMKIGFVNYNQFYPEGESRVLADIARLQQSVDILFVYTHWGAEYVPATSEEKRLAHLFIDRGADAVVGSHPHVIQEKEMYHGKTIYYSLGNFVFDQYFSADVKRGLMAEATVLSDHTISFREVSVELSPDGRTSVVR